MSCHGVKAASFLSSLAVFVNSRTVIGADDSRKSTDVNTSDPILRTNFNGRKYEIPNAELVYTFPTNLPKDKMATLKSMPLFCFFAQHHPTNWNKVISTMKLHTTPGVKYTTPNVQFFPFITTDYFKNECYCYCILFDFNNYQEHFDHVSYEQVAIVLESSIPAYELTKSIITELYENGVFEIFLNKDFRDNCMKSGSTLIAEPIIGPYERLLLLKAQFLKWLDLLVYHIPLPAPSKLSTCSVEFSLIKNIYNLSFPDIDELPFCNVSIF